MANAFSDPQVGRAQIMAPGAGPLSSSQNLNPNQWSNTNQQQQQTNWGAPNQPLVPQDNMFGGNFGNQQQPPWWWLNQQQQQQNQPYQGQKLGITGGGSYQDTTSTTPADLSPQSYQDYLGYGRSVMQGVGGLMGPVGGLFGLAADYNMGYNTFSPNKGENLGFQNPLTGEYTSFYNENYQGPGSDEYSNMNPSEQRDMMINQFGYDTRSPQDESFLSGLFGGNQLNYDPDLDLGLDSEGNFQEADDWVDWNDPDDFDDSDFDGNGFDDSGDDFGGWDDDAFSDDSWDSWGGDDDGDW